MTCPKISFLIPTRNRDTVVEKCVMSLLNSGREDIEIIVRDNYSTDNTVNILKKFKDKRLKIYQATENQGTRNFFEIAKFATGDVVTWLSDEDNFEFSNLNYVLSKFEDKLCSVMIGGIIVGKSQSRVMFNDVLITDPVKSYLTTIRFSGCGGVFIRRSALRQLLKLRIFTDDDAYYCWNYYPIGFFATYALNGGLGSLQTTEKVIVKQVRHAKTTNNWSIDRLKQNKLPHYYPESVYDRLTSNIVFLQNNIKITAKAKIVYSLMKSFYTQSKIHSSSSLIALLKENYDEEVVDKFIAHIEKLNLDNFIARTWYCLRLTLKLPISVIKSRKKRRKLQGN